MYNLKDYPKFKISRLIEDKTKKLVLQNLGLANLNQLRDRFEGTAYYNKFRSKLFSIIAINDYFKISSDSIFNNNIDVENCNLSIGNKNIAIIDSEIYEPFLVSKTALSEYLVFTYTSTNNNIVYIMGQLPQKALKSLIDPNISAMNERKYKGCIRDWKSFFPISTLL